MVACAGLGAGERGKVGPVVEGPRGDEAEAHAAGVEGLATIDGAQQVGIDRGDRAGDDPSSDEDLVKVRCRDSGVA